MKINKWILATIAIVVMLIVTVPVTFGFGVFNQYLHVPMMMGQGMGSGMMSNGSMMGQGMGMGRGQGMGNGMMGQGCGMCGNQSTPLSEEELAELAESPNGELIVQGMSIYQANCIGCHGVDGAGSNIAPALNDATLREQKSDEMLHQIISEGVPGTIMVGWENQLTEDEITNVVGLIRHWDEVEE